MAAKYFFFPILSLHFSFGITRLPKLDLNSECCLSDDFCLQDCVFVRQELTHPPVGDRKSPSSSSAANMSLTDLHTADRDARFLNIPDMK